MEKAVLNQATLERLNQGWRVNEVFVVRGINGIGQEFITTMRVATDDKGGFGAYEDAIYLESGVVERGKDNHKSSNEMSDFYVAFRTELDKYSGSYSLVLLSIEDRNGNVVFQNSNEEQIKERANQEAEKQQEEYHQAGRDITPETTDEVIEKLQTLIGRPVRLPNGNTGILACADGFNNFGTLMVEIRVGGGVGSGHINTASDVVMSYDEADQEIAVYSRKSRNERESLVNARLRRLEEAKQKVNQPD